MIFSFFAKKGGLSPLRKATFDEMRHNMTAIDLQEFLAFCKHYEVPLNSKVQLKVFRKIVDGSPTGTFTKLNFKDALKLLFQEVHQQKVAGLELLLRKRIKQINSSIQNRTMQKDESKAKSEESNEQQV